MTGSLRDGRRVIARGGRISAAPTTALGAVGRGPGLGLGTTSGPAASVRLGDER